MTLSLEKLKALIIYFVANSTHRLGRTELIKLLYLFEHYHTLAFGGQFSSASFIRYQYGPYSPAVLTAVEQLPGIVVEESYMGTYGTGYKYHIGNVSIPEQYELPIQHQVLCKFVKEQVKGQSIQEIKDYVYSTAPMVKVLAAETADGYPHYEEELDMSARKPIPKFTKQELLEAKDRNRLRKRRGSDSDYMAHLLNEHQVFGPLRRRANECVNGQR